MDGVWRKLLLLLIRATATDDVAYGQNNNVSDPTVSTCRGVCMQRMMPPVVRV